ncbi:MtrAB system histidine kinase MtrB [Desertivibrio insolitus]|uniref:MtrAB system histidine kinase MtrB n=1 Tax=Herbiconiux sp. SYSU D00978 TaxID=2812562 RepID=UPI001A96BAFC|nr:MtrAB system histidine kinase MtrB [Herbiconiux sp. SYSU D00978]
MTGRRIVDLLRKVPEFWRTSLQFRAVASTMLLSGFVVTLIVSSMVVSIGTNLFEARRDQIETEAERATLRAQSLFDNSTATQGTELDTLGAEARNAILQSTSTPSSTDIAIFRVEGQEVGQAVLQNQTSPGFPDDQPTDDLRASVASQADRVSLGERGSLFLQSITVPREDAPDVPGLIVGSLLTVPGSGVYELYLVFDLSDTQETLTTVQQTLAIGSIALLALIAIVTWVVVRFVVGPIREAAETSERLAAGELEVRLPERGEDVLATLARSFNGMADSLQSQITQLAELSRVQQRFVSDVSHELRTPLTTIRLAGDVLYDARDDFPPTTARTAELLHDQIERFETLLADLLEVSRFDAGAVELETEPTNLVRLAEDAMEQMRPLAVEHGSNLRLVALGGYFDAEVDPRRVRRIMRNLLGNAVEHGEGRDIVVTVDSNEEAVALAVRDYGVGMDEDQVEHVFDRFWRGDPSRKRTIGGTGLGLAISLEDALLHRGWLEAWSRKGAGACFRLTLPRDIDVPITVSPLPLPPADAEPRPATAPIPTLRAPRGERVR